MSLLDKVRSATTDVSREISDAKSPLHTARSYVRDRLNVQSQLHPTQNVSVDLTFLIRLLSESLDTLDKITT